MAFGESEAVRGGLRVAVAEAATRPVVRTSMQVERHDIEAFSIREAALPGRRARAPRGGNSVAEGCDLRVVDNLQLWRKEWLTNAQECAYR